MSARPEKRDLVLALHPHSKGLGWAAFEGPLTLHDWAVFRPKWSRSRLCLSKADRLIRALRPQVIVLESFGQETQRRARIRRLCEGILQQAAGHGVHVEIYGRDEVAVCFAEAGARTREEIAAAVARLLPALQERLPKPRRCWTSEDPRASVFAAAALALTHYRAESDLALEAFRRPASR